jgi:hypothetical protein
MQNFIAGAVIMLVAAAFAIYFMHKAQVIMQNAHLVMQNAHSIIHDRDLGEITRLAADNVDLRGRMFALKQMPPPGVDLKREYTEQTEKQKERQAKTEEERTINPRGTTMLDKARNVAIAAEATGAGAKKQGAVSD